MASTFTKCRFERVHGISSPGMLSTSENVDLGDASVGVARNPLRDGALPTGHFTGAFLSFEGILLLPLPRQNPRSLSPHFIVSRVSSFTTWVTACDALLAAGCAEESRSQASAFVKTMQVHTSKTIGSKAKSTSSRGLQCEKPNASFPRYDEPRGLYCPTASPTGFRPSRGRKATRSHGAPQLQR